MTSSVTKGNVGSRKKKPAVSKDNQLAIGNMKTVTDEIKDFGDGL